MSACVTPSQPVYVSPRQRRGFTDRSLVTEAPRLSTLHNGSSSVSPAQRTFILFPGNKRAKAHGGSPAREVPFSALPDRERETNLPHFRGPRLGWRFLMVRHAHRLVSLFRPLARRVQGGPVKPKLSDIQCATVFRCRPCTSL